MIRSILFFILFSPFCLQAAEVPKVLVTIKPVHSLVSSLLADITEPELLLDSLQSPHQYQLQPSDAKKIADANMVIWVGPALESFMHRQLENTKGKTIIQLTDAGSHTNTMDQLHSDPHRWLSPGHAITDTKRIKDKILEAYPHLKTIITLNYKRLLNRLIDFDQEIDRLFSQKRRLSIVLYHNAWQHFTTRFHLSVHDILNPSAHQQPGARHLDEVMQAIEKNKTRCLLAEPQFKSNIIDTISNKFNIEVHTVDPLGADQPEGVDAYFNMMRANANVFVKCR